MENSRCAVALGVVAALVFSAELGAQKKDKKQEEAEKKELQAIVKLVDAVVAGQPAPNDLTLAWVSSDFLKASGNKQYVPFTVAIDSSKASASQVAVYWRVVPKAAPVDPAAKKNEKKDDKKNIAYEDVTFVPKPASGPLRVSRSFTVGGGEFDVFVVAKEPIPQQRNAPPAKVSVMRHTVTVPDFWNSELATSSVIVAERIDPLPAPLTPEQQVERPYALGAMEILPAASTKFTKQSELSTFMLIYNAKTDAANKPDITVEYNFFTKQDGGEKPFNKTNPQNLNAQTLPPEFDFAMGHQLQSGQAVPLASFPDGEYRLEIKITDKLATKTLTRDINFSVSGS
jgi:hypothetical protein